MLRPGQEGTALGAVDRVKPDLSDVELDAKLFKAEVRLSDEVLEDSIERGELRQTIMEMLADAIARDMEDVAINGDTASVDPFLATMDGILKQATSNAVDAAGTPITKDLLRDMPKTLPSEYLRDKKAMRFLSSVDADLGYRNTLADRATVGRPFPRGRHAGALLGRAAAAHSALPREPRRGRRPDGHRAVQPEERPRRHLAKHPLRVRPRHLGGHAEDRRNLRFDVKFAEEPAWLRPSTCSSELRRTRHDRHPAGSPQAP